MSMVTHDATSVKPKKEPSLTGPHHPMAVLRRLRKSIKMRQDQVADKGNLSREAYLRAEGGTSDPRLSTVIASAAAMGYKIIFVQMTEPEQNAWAASMSWPASRVGVADEIFVEPAPQVAYKYPVLTRTVADPEAGD